MAKKSNPKVLGKKIAAGKSANARLNMRSRMGDIKQKALPAKRKKAAKTKTQRGEAAKVLANNNRRQRRVKIPGRHVAANERSKTGYWRPVRQPWMTTEIWETVKAMHKMRRDALTKEARKFAKGDKAFGKEGPGHAGYGTGAIQKWADKMIKQGVDPHFVNLLDWFVDASRAYNGLNGGDFDQLFQDAKGDKHHFMREVFMRLRDMVPEASRMSDNDIKEAIKHNFYEIQYGPDGRPK